MREVGQDRGSPEGLEGSSVPVPIAIELMSFYCIHRQSHFTSGKCFSGKTWESTDLYKFPSDKAQH